MAGQPTGQPMGPAMGSPGWEAQMRGIWQQQRGTQMAAGPALAPGSPVTVYIRGMNRPGGDQATVVGPGSTPGTIKVSVGSSGSVYEVDATTLRPR